MKKYLMLAFGVFAYLMFILTIAYSAAFFGNLFVARTIDAAAIVPIGEGLGVNIALLMLFGLQHSGMARKPFKAWLQARMSRCLERSTYVLASSIVTVVVMALWQPMGGVVWAVSQPILINAIYVLYFAGWALMLHATFLINHFRLFGLQQAWTAFHGDDCTESSFQTPGLYRHVRHPIYLGWILVMWASPMMTVTHLVFSGGMTIYMLIGIHLEECDLVSDLPDYRQYRRKVPMLMPSPTKRLLK